MNLRVFYLYKTVGFGWLQKIHPVSEVDLVVNLYMNYE